MIMLDNDNDTGPVTQTGVEFKKKKNEGVCLKIKHCRRNKRRIATLLMSVMDMIVKSACAMFFSLKRFIRLHQIFVPIKTSSSSSTSSPLNVLNAINTSKQII